MEKLFERKNLGIPAALLVLISYFIGYYFSSDLSGLLVAVIFGLIVFALDFDDKVKTAVKQSYVVGLAFALIYMLVGILYQFSNMITTITNYQNPLHIQTIFNDLYVIIHNLLNVADILVFAILIIMSFAGKGIHMGFISGMLGDKPKKQNPPAFQQPIQPAPVQYQPPVTPVNQQPVEGPACHNCGTVNKSGAFYCSSCGQKLQ